MKGLQQILVDAAARRPDAVAVTDERLSATYGQLDAASAALARRLLRIGVQKGDRVGLWIDKSADAIIAMQATLRVGAIYTPLDPRSPPARVESILKNCEATALITSADRLKRLSPPTHCRALIIDDEDDAICAEECPAPACVNDPEDLAYILYTSGSTGAPKGVCVSHRAALAFIEWAGTEIGATADDRFANHAPFHFDLSVLDIYVSMRAGARLFLIPETMAYLPQSLTEFATRNAVTVWYSVPSALILMLERGGLEERAPQLPLRVICFAGEVFPIAPLRRLRASFPEARLLNLYGPTETNVCTFFEVTAIAPDRIDPVPIGKASCGNRIWAETETGDLCRAGDIGELVVEGPTVMSGYWGGGTQAGPYRTGDLVRADAAGDYAFIARRDHMVKIRGHRIEPGEIEAALAARLSGDIEELAVVAAGEGGATRLRTCLVSRSDPAPSLLRCKQACAALLPRYMIVDEVMQFDRLPRTANGKIDRRRLAGLPFSNALQRDAMTANPEVTLITD